MRFYKYIHRRWPAILLLVTALFVAGVRCSSQRNLRQIIFIPRQSDKLLREAVEDFRYWIQKSSGMEFIVQQNDDPPLSGIRLVRNDMKQIPAKDWKRINEDGQSFFLSVRPECITIAGTGTNSFINGIYTLLHEAGFRWYMPGDNWVKMGNLNTLKNADKTYIPDFQNRFYFGSGGTRIIPGIDPDNSFSADFKLWDRRNRISSDYFAKTHSGTLFYRDNKAILDKHPEYFCNGKVNTNGWIDISNKQVVDLYVKWASSALQPGMRFPVIGVDPADGSGNTTDCLPRNMPGIKTWSDKYFWIANQVAQKLSNEDSVTWVELYAYNDHAAPPSFTLHKNVYPIVIPYAFQRVTAPEKLIALWRQKMGDRPMGIYDYWNTTQWSKCLPQFNISNIPAKIKLWKANNVTTINLESTYAKGPMGHAFWLASQLMWDASLSFDKLYNEFLEDCFGAASSDVRRMYDRWSNNFQQEMDVDISLRDLAAASSKTKDKAVQSRLSELKAYVHYMKLYFDYMVQRDGASYNALISYLYSVHHLRILHTVALERVYIEKPEGFDANKNLQVLNSSKIAKRTNAAIEADFLNDLKTNAQSYPISTMVFDIEKAVKAPKRQAEYNPVYINGKNTYDFVLNEARQFSFEAGVTKQGTKVVITDNTGKEWLSKQIDTSSVSNEKIALQLPAGHYSLIAGEPRRFTRLVFPADIVFISSDKNYDNYKYPVQYVYIPADVSEIIYRDEHAYQQKGKAYWLDPDKKKISPEYVRGRIYKVTVPVQYRGKVWAFNFAHSVFEMLNVPNRFSLNDFSYK